MMQCWCRNESIFGTMYQGDFQCWKGHWVVLFVDRRSGKSEKGAHSEWLGAPLLHGSLNMRITDLENA